MEVCTFDPLHPFFTQSPPHPLWPGWKARFRILPCVRSGDNGGDRIQETAPRPRRPRLPASGLGPHPSRCLRLLCRCWVRSSWVHRVLVMGYGGLTSLFNLVVLAWALRVLSKLRVQEKAPGTRACRDTVTVLGLTVLLGTTWALAFFSFSVFLLPQLFLFTIFNSLYGRACGWRGGNPWGRGWIVDSRCCLLLKGSRSRGLKFDP